MIYREDAQLGFTLIELMIVVAVMAVLAMIAYPSYESYILRSRRADTKTVLMEAAAYMERNFTESGAYDVKSDGSGTALPAPLTASPKDGTTKYYNITLVAADLSATTYTLRATPTGSQTSDQCGSLTLTNTGSKSMIGAAASMTVDTCWNK